MKNKSLRFKLYALSSFLILLSIVVGIIGYVSEVKIVDEYSYVAERNLPNIKSVGLMISRYRLARALATELGITEITKEHARKTIESYQKAWEDFEVEHKKYLAIEFAPGEDELYQDFKTKLQAIKASLDKVVSTYEEGVKQGSVDQKKISEIIFREASANGDAMRDAGNKILAFHVERADLRVDNAKAVTEKSTYTILATILIGTAVGILFAVTFSNALVSTLTKISQALNEAGMEVSSGSNQIASTAQELSQATTEQSASLEQTAASIEEMNSMVQKSAENAKMTYSYAVNSKESAVTGKEVVIEMIDSIEEINKSNQDIMIAIDESNKKMEEIALVIGDIANKTKVINDIVFQTKLLSFNASVEAARAGEMGKGFAVVAEEVGNLAEMSGKASKEISDMLTSSISKVDDIVRTTKARVEQLVEVGKKKVDAGTNIAKKCGEVLDTIVINVDDVNKLASEISEASEEQAKGIQEISKAAGMLETVTQQNSTASEESARAAEELSRQAMSLNQIVLDLVGTINGSATREVEQNTYKQNVVPLKKKEKQVVSKRSSNFKKTSGDFSAPTADDSRFMDA